MKGKNTMGIVISSFIIFFILNKYKLVINFGMHPVFSTVLIISIYVYFIYWFSKQYSKEDNKKQNKIILNCCIFINEYLPSIFFATGLLFSIIGLNEMLINAKLSAIIDGLSIIAHLVFHLLEWEARFNKQEKTPMKIMNVNKKLTI